MTRKELAQKIYNLCGELEHFADFACPDFNREHPEDQLSDKLARHLRRAIEDVDAAIYLIGGQDFLDWSQQQAENEPT